MAGNCAGRGRRGAQPLPPGARLAGPRCAEFPVGRRPRGAEGEERRSRGRASRAHARPPALRGGGVAPSDSSPSAEPKMGRVQADRETSCRGSRAARPWPALSYSGSSRRPHLGRRGLNTSRPPLEDSA